MSNSKTQRRSSGKKTKSGCNAIKRSAVCKRKPSCTYVRGTKRRYCRTSKNRHTAKYLASRKNKVTRKNKSKSK